MEWQIALLIIMGSIVVLMVTGMPIAFCFMLVNIVGLFVWWGGQVGLEQLILSVYQSVSTFHLLPIPLFVLMGEVMFHSKLAPDMIDTLDKWLGRLPGRLGLLAVGGGTLFATLSGSSMSSVAMLGSVLTPELEKRGYGKAMSLGPILGSGGLAMMIPPSNLGVLLGAIGEISIGEILIAIVIPGLLMAVLYAAYIIVRCHLQPQIAPAYEVAPTPMSRKILATVKYILPLGIIVFLVTGVIILGIATPTEAAATGTLGALLLAAAFGRINLKMLKQSFNSTLAVTGMIFLIITGAQAFSQNLAYTGASRGLAEFILGLSISPIAIILAMQVVILFFGMFMSAVPIMMICLPIFVPVVMTLGFSEVWFAVLFLVNLEMGQTTPPMGVSLFVMKGVAPPDTTMGDIIRSALPFLACDLIAMILITGFPQIALWLPSIMRQ